jgi:hypothetical protein
VTGTDTAVSQATADLRPAPRPPDLDNAPADQKTENRPGGWDWAAQTDRSAAVLAQALDRFVVYFNHRYAWTRDQTIPPCWAEHGPLIEEVTTLMWSRWGAFQGPLAGPEAAQTWHTYHLPLFTARIIAWIGAEAAADCRAGHHQPSRLHHPDRPPATARPVPGRARP